MRFKVLMLTAAMVAVAAGAQAQSIAGKWTATFPMRVRMDNGSPSAEQEGKAVIELTQKGDSVFGTWQTQNTPAPVPPRQLSGTFKAGKLELVSSPTAATVHMNGNESSVMMRTYYEGTVTGDAIDGTMHSKSEDGNIESPPMKWTARVQRSVGLSGEWDASVFARIEIVNGAESRSAIIERWQVEQKGDSIFGHAVAVDAAERATDFKGVVQGDKVTFQAGPIDAINNNNGEVTRIPMMLRFEGMIKGGEMKGTMVGRPVSGGDPGPTIEWTAKRRSS